MPWAGNIAKTMTSIGKQFTVTREILTAGACDQRWPDVVTGISAHFSKFALVFLFWILLPLNLNVSLDFVSGNIEILGKRNSLFPSGPVIKCLLLSWVILLSPTFWLSAGKYFFKTVRLTSLFWTWFCQILWSVYCFALLNSYGDSLVHGYSEQSFVKSSLSSKSRRPVQPSCFIHLSQLIDIDVWFIPIFPSLSQNSLGSW